MYTIKCGVFRSFEIKSVRKLFERTMYLIIVFIGILYRLVSVAGSFSFYANKAPIDKRNRIAGHRLQKLRDNLTETNYSNTQNEYINKQAIPNSQYVGESEESSYYYSNS